MDLLGWAGIVVGTLLVMGALFLIGIAIGMWVGRH